MLDDAAADARLAGPGLHAILEVATTNAGEQRQYGEKRRGGRTWLDRHAQCRRAVQPERRGTGALAEQTPSLRIGAAAFLGNQSEKNGIVENMVQYGFKTSI